VELSTLRPDLGWRYLGDAHGAESAQAQDLICAHLAGSEAYNEALNLAQSNGWRFRYVPEMGAQYAGEMHLESLEGIPLFSFRSEPLANWPNKLLKRFLDILISLVLLITIASWLIPLCALLLLITGAGRPWFIQEREGLEGQTFFVLKMRTMNAAGNSNFFQRHLRRAGLDELPQLINVLFGQMSMVGPRPHTAGDGVHYASKAAAYKIRHWAKPGLTGLAQVRGLRGGESAQSDHLLEARIRADVYYVEHWSLLLDLRILIETAIRTVFAPSSLHTNE
jgi:lipopolysaccharide/colanic/teichoic acid biosynthesis glycosyltransferase